MTTATNLRDQGERTTRNSEPANPVFTILNGLLSAAWQAHAQHQTHIALIEAWGLQGLAYAMRTRTADEPATINALLNRLCDLKGTPAFTIESPLVGANLRDVLDKDMLLQSYTRPKLNSAAEVAATAHDATTRNLIEQILADEEKHLSWLETEIDLHEKLGETLYSASRLQVSTT
jgi:bacterioferritin